MNFAKTSEFLPSKMPKIILARKCISKIATYKMPQSSTPIRAVYRHPTSVQTSPSKYHPISYTRSFYNFNLEQRIDSHTIMRKTYNKTMHNVKFITKTLLFDNQKNHTLDLRKMQSKNAYYSIRKVLCILQGKRMGQEFRISNAVHKPVKKPMIEPCILHNIRTNIVCSCTSKKHRLPDSPVFDSGDNDIGMQTEPPKLRINKMLKSPKIVNIDLKIGS